MTKENGQSDSRNELRDALTELGFSAYEAKCYVGLVGTKGLTGYGVSKATSVPQPKVYETLRRLVRRGAARQVSDEPAVFVATPPSKLLDLLEQDFRNRHTLAAEAATGLDHEDEGSDVVSVTSFATRDTVVAAARGLIATAHRRVYLSASVTELDELTDALRAAVDRGVDVILLDFGTTERQESGMRVFRHASTERAIYRHHQARHLALVADSHDAVNAVAVDGISWEGVQSSNTAIIAAIKGMIRHDIDMQQVYSDFRTELVSAYGPGLQALESYRVPVGEGAEEKPEGRLFA